MSQFQTPYYQKPSGLQAYQTAFGQFNIPGIKRSGTEARQNIMSQMISRGFASSTGMQNLLRKQKVQEDEQVRFAQHEQKRKKGWWKKLLASGGGALLGGLLGGPVGAGIGSSLAGGLVGGGGGGQGGGLMQQIGSLGGGQSATSPFMQLLGLLGGGGGKKTPVSSIPGYEQFGLNRKQRLGLGGSGQGQLPQLYYPGGG